MTYVPRLLGLSRRIRRRYKPMSMPSQFIDKDGSVYTWKAWRLLRRKEGKFALIDTLDAATRRAIWGRDYDSADSKAIKAPKPRRVPHSDLAWLLVEATAQAERAATTDWGHMTGRKLECKK